MFKFYKSLFLSSLFYITMGVMIVTFIVGQVLPLFFLMGQLILVSFFLLVVLDLLLLYLQHGSAAMIAARILPDRFSNGDNNQVKLSIKNGFPFPVRLKIIDEVPSQFQKRDFMERVKLSTGGEKNWVYELRPVIRGEYFFGGLNIFAASPLGLVNRRFVFDHQAIVKVYPSFIEMKKFELMAISNRLTEIGIKKVRKIGHQMEFDQIRDYARGDDFRTVNWKATARKNHLMVNQYQDEKSQQIFSLIDMGRTMQMPFNGMTLLDYAINTSLVISKIAMIKYDKAGLITFNDKVCTHLSAQRNGQHLNTIMETLYNQQTTFAEHNLSALYNQVRMKIHQRSLLMVYTNFESLSSGERQLNFLKRLAREHLVVLIFFENTEIIKMSKESAKDIKGIYVKTIAEKFVFDKKLLVKELERNGIYPILTDPQKLTVNAINKYLELKARGVI